MKKYNLILILFFIISCSTKKPDLKIKEVSWNNIGKIEKLSNFILINFTNLLDSCKQHTACSHYNGEKCYFPANSTLLHKYLNNQKELEHLDYLTYNGTITGNIDIRNDSTIRFQVKRQLIRGNFDTYNDTIYLHEIVYHISKRKVYELEEYIVVELKQIKPNWTYFIIKQWVD